MPGSPQFPKTETTKAAGPATHAEPKNGQGQRKQQELRSLQGQRKQRKQRSQQGRQSQQSQLRQHTHRRQLTPITVTLTLSILGVLAILAMAAEVSLGPLTIPFSDTLAALIGRRDSSYDAIIHGIRLPRAIIAALAGSALAVSGVLMQAVFRNPLADPGIIGVSSGAATGAVIALLTGASFLGTWTLPALAFLGALITVAVVQLIAARVGGAPSTLILVGVAISALLGALIQAAITNAPTDSQVRGVTFWLSGDLIARTWDHVTIATAPILIALACTFFLGRELNIMLMGDATAYSTGVDVRRIRFISLSLASILTATAVSVSGILAFVGLVVPHLLRLVIGPDHRLLLPASALAGAIFVLAADVVARMVLSPVVLLTGTVVSLVGAPVFLALLIRTHRPRPGGIA